MILANNDIGLYQFRNELIEELLKYHEVLISLPNGEFISQLESKGCKFVETLVDRRGVNPATDLKLFYEYKRILKLEKPDLVITYTIKPNVYGGLACRTLRIPYVVNITGLGTVFESGGLLRKFVIIMYMVVCKRAKVVFFENEENRLYFIRKKMVKAEQTYRLNGAGVNLKKYKVSEYPAGETTRFLFIGRVMSEKGIRELFASMKKLVSEGAKCELDILGEFEENYKDQIEKYETEEWLNYHGYQKDVRPFIEKCHCFVLPSWHEGMANSNLECAASGRPVITSNISGCMEAVIDGISGYLCKIKNADDLYRVMKKFIKLTYAERKAMGLAGRKHMEESFDKEEIVFETMEAMNQIYLEGNCTAIL